MRAQTQVMRQASILLILDLCAMLRAHRVINGMFQHNNVNLYLVLQTQYSIRQQGIVLLSVHHVLTDLLQVVVEYAHVHSQHHLLALLGTSVLNHVSVQPVKLQ